MLVKVDVFFGGEERRRHSETLRIPESPISPVSHHLKLRKSFTRKNPQHLKDTVGIKLPLQLLLLQEICLKKITFQDSLFGTFSQLP